MTEQEKMNAEQRILILRQLEAAPTPAAKALAQKALEIAEARRAAGTARHFELIDELKAAAKELVAAGMPTR